MRVLGLRSTRRARPLRVLLVAPSLDLLGGQAVQALLMMRCLAREPGVEPRFVPFDPRLPGVLRLLQGVKYLRTVVTSIAYVCRLLLRIPQTDVVHIFSHSGTSFVIATMPAILLAKLFRKPVIVHYHSNESDRHLRQRAARMMRLTDAIVVPSEFMAAKLAEYGFSAQIIANFIDLDQFQYRERRPVRPVFLSNRQLLPNSNVDRVLRAFARVRNEVADARLIVAADGPERRSLEQLARELGLDDVQFTGWVHPDAAVSMYAGADVFLNATDLDNQPVSILEAFAAGLPVVSTDAGGIPELVEPGVTGLIVPRRGDAELAQAALSLLEDPELGPRLARSAHGRAQAFGWSGCRSAWLELYALVADRGDDGARRRDVAFYAPTATPLLIDGVDAVGGGAENQTLMIARALVARGLSVAIVAAGDPRGLRETIDGVEVIAQPLTGTRVPGIRTLVTYARAAGALRAARPRVVVQMAASSYTPLAWLLARALRARFVYHSASLIDFDYGLWEPRRWLVWLYGRAVRRADEFVAATEEQASLCRERFGRQPLLIKSIGEPLPGAGPTVAASPPKDGRDAFLWVGRLVDHKQPLAYAELARAAPEAHFQMIAVDAEAGGALEVLATGTQSDRLGQELKAAAAALPNLELLAPRPRHELAPLVERAVAIVSTSRSEGLPNVFMEGWNLGIPALALDHDPNGLIERERLGGFAHGSPERLAAAARELWAQRHDLAEVGDRCRRYMEREHAVGPIAEEWIEALRSGR